MSIARTRPSGNRPRVRPPENLLEQLLVAARYWHTQHGYTIVPMRVTSTGKKASNGRWKHWQAGGQTLKEVEDRVDHPRTTGIAVLCGSASGGLIVCDFDDRAAYAAWRAFQPDLASSLPTVETKRGFHVHFRCPTWTQSHKYADGELLADGHLAILPPSWHPAGIQYRWVHLPATIPTIDDPVAVGLALGTLVGTHTRTQCNGLLLPAAAPCSVEEAIAATVPNGPRQRNRQIFDFALALKGVDATESPETLRMYVMEWHARALPYIRTKSFQTTLDDFIVAWNAIKSKPLSMAAIIESAQAMKTPPEAMLYAEPVRVLVKVCASLQNHWGDRPFFLSVREAKHVLETQGFKVSVSAAWRVLLRLQFDQVLLKIKTGVYRGEGQTSKATEWRYLLNQ